MSNILEIEDTSGILLSPGFPLDYPNGFHCGWNLNVPTGTQVTLQFWAFDIEVKITLFQIPNMYYVIMILYFI